MKLKLRVPFKPLVITILFAGIFLIALCVCTFRLFVAVGGGGACSNEIIQEAIAPDGHSKAFIYLRNCGATVGYTSHVSILKENQVLSEGKGNVFQARDSSAWDSIDIIWQDNSTLEVYHQSSVEHVDVENKRVGDYQIVWGTCENERVIEVVSPDRQYTAILYERHCGKNSGFTTHISIFESNREYSEKHGNVLQAFGNNANNSIMIAWKSNDTLRVTHRMSDEKIIHQKESILGVNLIYAKLKD